MGDEKIKELYVRIWEKAIDTQMHFNEMSVKSRQLGLTFVAGALGVAVLLLRSDQTFALVFDICGRTLQLHVTPLLIVAAALALIAVRTLDLGVYHKMLRGAVTFGEDFERVYMSEIFDLDKGMTETISLYSRYEKVRKTLEETDIGKKRNKYEGETEKTAYEKIKRFYRYTIVSLFLAAAILLVVTNLTVSGDASTGETTQVNASK